MYDPLWENHPKVKKIRAESEAKGEARGEAKGIVEGEVKALRMVIHNMVRIRYPELLELAQKRIEQIDSPEVLNFLVEQIMTAPDELSVRALLRPPAA